MLFLFLTAIFLQPTYSFEPACGFDCVSNHNNFIKKPLPSNPRCRHAPYHNLREQTREMFFHAWNSYKHNAFPWDELKPLSCQPRKWTHRERGTLDDSLGGFMTTAVDSLDTLAMMGEYKEFRRTIRTIVRSLKFDRDITISVFETNIRILGGLLSAHMLLEDAETSPLLLGTVNPYYDANDGEEMKNDHSDGRSFYKSRQQKPVLGGVEDQPLIYSNELLTLALDLGHRLLPAFRTTHGLPLHRVNLKYGIPKGETKETCLAAAGTIILEFGVLSRLSGVSTFEVAARKAVRQLYQRRSPLDLMGSTMDTEKGTWIQSHTSVGAGSDSFYEYM